MNFKNNISGVRLRVAGFFSLKSSARGTQLMLCKLGKEINEEGMGRTRFSRLVSSMQLKFYYSDKAIKMELNKLRHGALTSLIEYLNQSLGFLRLFSQGEFFFMKDKTGIKSLRGLG